MFAGFLARLALALLGSAMVFSAQAIDITGVGASFPYPVYAKWAARYHADTGARVNYQSIGSGGGQQQIITGTVDFGATDDPMDDAELRQHNLLQFPALVGGVVPVVNIASVGSGQLRLDGATLADIFLGRVTRWDDPAIRRLNPDLPLPAADIIVVHRADGSGTTFNFSHYLAQVSPHWKQTVGVGKAVKWPVGHGGKGNEGVSAYVRQLDNTIGYVEFAYATQNSLPWVQLQNQAGNFVEPSFDSFSAAAETANWQQSENMGLVLTNTAGEEAWPITAASFILVREQPRRPAIAHEVLQFFAWAFQDGAPIAHQLDYVSMPDPVVQLIEHRWHTKIRGRDGAIIWPNALPASQD